MKKTINYSVDADGIATLVIDLPGKSTNILTPELKSDISACVKAVCVNDNVKGAILTSGKAGFMTGVDIEGMARICDPGITVEEGYEHSRGMSRLLRDLETCGKPFAAAISGPVLSFGLELCLACHYRVLSDHPNSLLGFPEVSVGLMPGSGGTQRLPRLIGVDEALPLLLQGRKIKTSEALKLGVVDEIAPAVNVVERAKTWLLEIGDPVAPWDRKGFKMPGRERVTTPGNAQAFMVAKELLAKSAQHNYPAHKATLSAVYEGCMAPIDAGLDLESQYFGKVLAGPVARNMMRTLVVNKSKADNLARRPESVEKSRVSKLGILGAGMMGAGIAYVSARAGIEVVLLDTSLENAQEGKAYTEGLLKKAVERGKSTPEKAVALLNQIHPTVNYHDLQDCDLVIEAVFENQQVKADVTRKTEVITPESTIFASNTSTLQITSLAKASIRPQQFIGLHFFSPVDRMPLVEVILGEQTDEATLARSLDYIQQIRMTPIVVNDRPGFYTSRVVLAGTYEGIGMLAEGVRPALIENAAKLAGMPVGPLAVTDEVSLELTNKIGKELSKAAGQSYPSNRGQAVVCRMVEELDRRGKRFRKGFYEYPEGKRKFLWTGLAEYFPPSEEQPVVEEVKKRLLNIQALETARCVEEEVITDAGEADVGSIFGWGFPPYTGGTLSYIDTMGIGNFVAECDRMAKTYGKQFHVSDWLRKRAENVQSFHGG